MFLLLIMFIAGAHELQPTSNVTPVPPASVYQLQPTELGNDVQPASDNCAIALQGLCYQDN